MLKIVAAGAGRLPPPLLARAQYAHGWLAARGISADPVIQLPPTAFKPLLHRLLKECTTLLDVGSGPMTFLADLPVRTRVGVDAHRPYLEVAVRDHPEMAAINLDARRLASIFVERSFDAVTLIDVIEHFDEADGVAVLRDAESIARRVCVVFTPRGEFPQEAYDAYGLGGEEYQRHRSTWDERKLVALGYRCAILKGFHGPGNESFEQAFGPDAPPRDALLAWRSANRI